MTTIAWDGMTMAADRVGIVDGQKVLVNKIHELSDGSIAGIAGSLTRGLEIITWLEKTMNNEDIEFPIQASQDEPENGAWVLVVDGSANITLYTNSPEGVTIHNEKVALGSGGKEARVAMHFGANAIKAVETASLFDPDTGSEIQFKQPRLKDALPY